MPKAHVGMTGPGICHIEIHGQVLERHALNLHQGLGTARADRVEHLAVLYQSKEKP